MNKRHYTSLIISVAAVFVVFCLCTLWLKQRRQDEILHALGANRLPCEITIVDYSHDNFFDKSIAVEFELERKFVNELLKGRNWVRVANVDSIISMQGAVDGYTWSQGNKHSEIAFFGEGERTRCKLFYHVE